MLIHRQASLRMNRYKGHAIDYCLCLLALGMHLVVLAAVWALDCVSEERSWTR